MSEVTTDNKSIWNKVCDTPVERTQKFSYSAGGRQFTDINPQYRVERLTEIFGPCGLGWGYEIMDKWREDFNGVTCVFVMLRLWYFDKEAKQTCFTGAQIGGTAIQYSPDESWKMSITDALGKCAALLGVAADVYLGTFDTKYRDKATSQPAAGQVETKSAAPVTAKTASPKPVSAPVTAATQNKTPF